jgi:hypothetical protein
MAAHHSQTPKEKCFQSAVEELTAHRERMGKETPTIDHQRGWTQNRDTQQWRPEPNESTFGRIMGSIAKTLRIMAGNAPAEEGRWPTGQPRFPDVTVTTPDGKSVVVDTKFDRPSGGRDEWGTKPGQYSNQDQRTDYNEMNKQQTGKENQDLSLDPDNCKCSEDPSPVEEVDPALAPDGQFFVVPFGQGALPAVPELPILEPIPVPIFF